MKLNTIFLASVMALSFANTASAVEPVNLAAPLPVIASSGVAPIRPAPVVPAGAAMLASSRGPAGAVDKVLERIARNMTPPADLIDSQAETAMNRDITLSRSTGQILRPVGFMQVENERVIFASEDGVRVVRLKENSRLGVMKITGISEYGVDYTVSGKAVYAPLAYMPSEGPRANGQAADGKSQGSTPLSGLAAAPAPVAGLASMPR